jgi:uncharacterized protein (TIGR02186 family)
MMRACIIFVMAAVASLSAFRPAAAERIVSSLSTHRVLITSNFTGAELILFGSIELDTAPAPRRGGYDVVVTVIGPRHVLVTRRKERVFGIWVNTDSRVFIDPPAYLATFANRPLNAIANAEIRRRLQIGFENMQLPQRIGADVGEVTSNDPFRTAFIRLKSEHELYREEPNAVTFLTPNLFRTGVPLPADAPIGNYEVDVKLFTDGAMIARTNSAFELVKFGFEQFVADAAHSHGLLYGLATALMALATGWLASVMFRRD